MAATWLTRRKATRTLLSESFWENATVSDVRGQLEKGADLGAKDEDGRTPLHRAAVCGGKVADDTVAVRLFLESGADVEAKAKHGRTPLHEAASIGHAAAVKLLLDLGADLKVADNQFGQTPLHMAAFNGHASTVMVLLESGADLETRDEYVLTPLHVIFWPNSSVLLARKINFLSEKLKGI